MNNNLEIIYNTLVKERIILEVVILAGGLGTRMGAVFRRIILFHFNIYEKSRKFIDIL